jgi:hypothetical protein
MYDVLIETDCPGFLPTASVSRFPLSGTARANGGRTGGALLHDEDTAMLDGVRRPSFGTENTPKGEMAQGNLSGMAGKAGERLSKS